MTSDDNELKRIMHVLTDAQQKNFELTEKKDKLEKTNKLIAEKLAKKQFELQNIIKKNERLESRCKDLVFQLEQQKSVRDQIDLYKTENKYFIIK